MTDTTTLIRKVVKRDAVMVLAARTASVGTAMHMIDDAEQLEREGKGPAYLTYAGGEIAVTVKLRRSRAPRFTITETVTSQCTTR